jgi:hypothetical protein
VVKLSPDDLPSAPQTPPVNEAAKHADDEGPRPVIRATGMGEGRIDNLDAQQSAPVEKDKKDGD